MVKYNMTQYHHERPATTAVEPTVPKTNNKTVQDINRLEEKIRDQERSISALQKLVKKLQNELRTAINAFNSGTRG
jgi:septal ring factor EnvC (AmiA/AmiB activator)